MTQKVNFFIVGAQRCGTTALSAYLRTHPDICFSKPKEPHYFADDMPGVRIVRTEAEYQSLFKNCNGREKQKGEGSTGYLQSSRAIQNIHQYNPNAKIIVMLRNPVDMIHSLHAHLYFRGFEDERDFIKAWKLQDSRAKGHHLPKDPRLHIALQYRKVGSYYQQVLRLFDFFPREQIKLILFDDFIKSPQQVFEDTLRFLGLKSDGRKTFDKVNENRSLRMPIAVDLYRKAVPWVIRRPIQYFIRSNRIAIRLFNKLFVKVENRGKISRGIRKVLTAEFSEDVKRLSFLIERDLNGWM